MHRASPQLSDSGGGNFLGGKRGQNYFTYPSFSYDQTARLSRAVVEGLRRIAKGGNISLIVAKGAPKKHGANDPSAMNACYGLAGDFCERYVPCKDRVLTALDDPLVALGMGSAVSLSESITFHNCKAKL